jgi:KilA-N domain
MSKPKHATIKVQGTSIAILSLDRQDFIFLTDIAKLKNPDHPDDVIRNWLRSRSSVEFRFYLIKEFQRLKDDENHRLKLDWNLQRTLAKINHRIHTEAIKDTLIPPSITKDQTALVYAHEADLLNVALFGQTAKQWRDTHPDAEGNLRDHAL